MTPYIGMPIALFGGLDNGQFEHSAVVTFVHKNFRQTLDGQLGLVNVRVFLDGSVTDRVLKMVPLMESKGQAVNIHAYGVSHAAFLPDFEDDMLLPTTQGDDNLPPMPAMVAVPPYMTEVQVH